MYASDYRRIARERLANNWSVSIGIAVIASLLGGLLVGSSFLPEFNFNVREYSTDIFGGDIQISIDSGAFLGLPAFILGGVLELGYSAFLLKQYDQQPASFQDLFSQFERFGAGFCQAFLRGLYTALWSLLFIIPGIVAHYRYAMTPFIMLEKPELSASEAINASKELMYNHKWELFCLDFSFIGWVLLCVLTLNIGHIALNPYRNAAYAVFYRTITDTRTNSTSFTDI